MITKTSDSLFKKYILLTKPGIIIGNLITAAAGFFLASQGNFDWRIFTGLIFGTAFIIGASCVVNNYLDREIDEKMERTKNRAFVKKDITFLNAAIYAAILFVLGIYILFSTTNLLTVKVGLIGVFFYVVMYSIWKRKSDLSTVIGSVSGAIPPLAGFTAVANNIDLGASLLFLMLVFWQMPHFYAIGIYRLSDYANAKIPILPVVKGAKTAKIHSIFYIIAFIITTQGLVYAGYTGFLFQIVSLLGGFYWLKLCVDGFAAKDDKVWARKMFKYSVRFITVICIMIVVESVLKSMIRF